VERRGRQQVISISDKIPQASRVGRGRGRVMDGRGDEVEASVGVEQKAGSGRNGNGNGNGIVDMYLLGSRSGTLAAHPHAPTRTRTSHAFTQAGYG